MLPAVGPALKDGERHEYSHKRQYGACRAAGSRTFVLATDIGGFRLLASRSVAAWSWRNPGWVALLRRDFPGGKRSQAGAIPVPGGVLGMEAAAGCSPMSIAAALVALPAAHSRFGELRRAILSDHAGKPLGEVPLESAPGARFPARHDAAQVLVAAGANWSDRPCTGDAIHVVIGRRACFGYVVDVDGVCWFSHPRLTRVDAFSSLADREVRRLLYDLHSGDLDTVSEIIWETSGRISAHRAPALPVGIDPRTRGSLDRERDSAAYWRTIVQILTDGARRGGASSLRAGRAVAPARLV